MVDTIDKACQRPVGSNQYSEGVVIHNTPRPAGHGSQAYILRRLRRDHPDLHVRVLPGGIGLTGPGWGPDCWQCAHPVSSPSVMP